MSLMDTDIDTSVFESLVYEPEYGCEHPYHPSGTGLTTDSNGVMVRSHHADTSSYYLVMIHAMDCGHKTDVTEGEMIVCEAFAKATTQFSCPTCHATTPRWQRMTIIERIK